MSDIIETIACGGKLLETVEIIYKDSNGRVITTETEPYEIRGGIFVCWCSLRNRMVEILLSSIIDAVITGNSNKPRFQVGFKNN